MKNILTSSLAVALASALVSCGGGSKQDQANAIAQSQAKNTVGALTNLAANANGAAAAANAAQEKMKERRAKGDTLAMPYADLQKFLPQSLSGYNAGTPDGSSVNMTGMSYSNASIRFTKANGDYVKVSIVDYNQAYQLFAGATAMWAMDMSVDSPEEKGEGVKLDNNAAGWEDYKKKSKDANITLGVGSRFLITVEANNQTDVSMVKSVAQTIDLAKLAAM